MGAPTGEIRSEGHPGPSRPTPEPVTALQALAGARTAPAAHKAPAGPRTRFAKRGRKSSHDMTFGATVGFLTVAGS